MTPPEYHRLSREQVQLLLAPKFEDARQAWSSLTGSLHAIMSMLSVTHPRPLYWDPVYDHQRLVEDPERLRGTQFHEPAVRNATAAQEVERMFRERGHSAELHEIVDRYLNALLDEFDEIRLYPEIPPRRRTDEENGLTARHAVMG